MSKTPILALLLGFLLSTAVFAEVRAPEEFQQALWDSRVVYLGESHTSETDHRGQLEILRQLHVLQDRPLIVLAEMLTELTEDEPELWKDQEIDPEIWKREWGFPYELYRSIFAYLREHKVPTLWLRPDPAFTTQVREQGPAAAVTKIDEVLLGPKSYREAMAEIAQAHLPKGAEASSEVVDRYFTIQCFWDEFMAWRIATVAEAHPEARIAVLVGYGHLHPGRGIPWRVQRRAPNLRALNIAFDREYRDHCDLLYLPSDP